jgi:two-component system CheB/CheR fusion protein
MTDTVRVLLIDDDEDDFRLTSALFADFDREGFQLEWESDYAAALASMLRAEHDIYLLDYKLGRRTGIDLLREARAAGFAAPAIMLTGQDERAVDVEAMRSGAADYLIKTGLDAAILERSIRYALEQKQHEEALRRSYEVLEQRVAERTAELAHMNAALQAEVVERKRAEAELTEIDRRKDEFLAMLAHELRNPLAPLLHGLEVLRLDTATPPSILPVRDLMERQVRKMTRLVDDLLDVSRITCGKVELRREPVDISRVVRLAAESLQQTIVARRQQLVIAVPAEPVMLDGDLTRLEQIISNLLSNASKYTDAGGRITLSAEREDHQAAIKISDTGVGISPEMLPKVFDLFMQVDRSLDRTQGGLGIGLTLVARLVALHGGTVEAHSAGLGQGSQFIVRLPLLMAGAPSAASSAALADASRQAQPVQRILLVDDNLDLVQSLALMLKFKGFDVRTASEGLAALELSASFQPHAVLLDIGLPGLTGYEIAERLRKQHPQGRLLLVALSGYGRDEDRQRSLEAGFDLHLVKPVDLARLMTALGQISA